MNPPSNPLARSLALGGLGLFIMFVLCFVFLEMELLQSSIAAILTAGVLLYFTFPESNDR